MGNDWERSQREKLVAKQKKRIVEMEKEIEQEIKLPTSIETEPKERLF